MFLLVSLVFEMLSIHFLSLSDYVTESISSYLAFLTVQGMCPETHRRVALAFHDILCKGDFCVIIAS